MKNYHDLLINLESNLKSLEEQQNDLLLKTEQAVKLCKQTLSELQKMVSKNGFTSTTEEIVFFKTIKPVVVVVVGKLIYYIEYFNIQCKRPKGIKKLQIKYLNAFILKLQEYYNVNMEFYHYYLKNETNLDKQFFLRKNKKVRLNIETYHFFTDQNFSSSHDNTVATIIAYEHLIIKLHSDINSLIPHMETTTAIKAFQNYNQLNWTGTKTDLIELIYALHSSGVINNGNVDIKDIATALEESFNIDLGNYYHSFVEMRTRKINQTKFIDKLKDSFLSYIKSLED